ncbi:hypothetical protein F511_05160 [Dorcoceras hygrometricum]|uniref:Uncharacterized protein n=1 Tax=Dorcoceras hygrometricum TaxID=472368 RepID=A0A2Z7C1X2_9LAMI|nr:hypothetical protein F511_05160 [Dorcoceras hygrometricum]
MERTEPTLVPEWLRSTGNVAAGGASANHSGVSSSLNSIRGKPFRSNSERDRPNFVDGNVSFNSRRSSSSTGPGKHPYSSFSRSCRDKNSDREKEKFLSMDIWDHDALASILTSRIENNALKRSHSLVSGKPGELLPHKADDSRNGINHYGVRYTGSNPSGIQKNTFEKDFPSLGTEEKHEVTGTRKILSPGLDSAAQHLPISNSGFLGCEKWTSALAEVPAGLTINGMNHSSSQQSMGILMPSVSGGSNSASLNMAEALSQSPAKVNVSQLPDKSQRLEELAIKQSRQLIPMTPSMPKLLVPSSADKLKQTKVCIKTHDLTVASKAVQLQLNSSHLSVQLQLDLSNLSVQSHVGQVKSDSSSTSHVAKYMVLKSGREGGFTTGTKDASSPCDSNCRTANGHLGISPSSPIASVSRNSSMVSVLENKTATLSLGSRSTMDKRLFQSMVKSRSEFFNNMRRKTSITAPVILSDSSTAVSCSRAETSGEIFHGGHTSISPCIFEHDGSVICNSDELDVPEKNTNYSDVQQNMSGNGTIYPDEEEAAFLRSLGWDENGGEDDGLTEEEINSFYQEVSS